MKTFLTIISLFLIVVIYAWVVPTILFCKLMMSLPKEVQEEFVCSVARGLIEGVTR